MSMKKAMQNKCNYPPYPIPFTPIVDGENPPYGNAGNQSEDLNVSELITKLLNGTLATPIHHIDVWGEGRIQERNHVTGFPTSYNINLNQGITYPSYVYHGYPIPNLLPVCNYDDSFDVIPTSMVKIVTIMGAPITTIIADEISRIVSHDGEVATFGYKYESKYISTLEASLSKIGFKRRISYELGPLYQAVSLKPVIVFSANSNPEPDLKDEL